MRELVGATYFRIGGGSGHADCGGLARTRILRGCGRRGRLDCELRDIVEILICRDLLAERLKNWCGARDGLRRCWI